MSNSLEWHRRLCERFGFEFNPAKWKRHCAEVRREQRERETKRQMRERFAKVIPKPRTLE